MQNVFFNAMLPVFTVISLSYVIGRFFSIDTREISNIAIYIFSPFLILQSLVGSDLELDDIGGIAAMVFFSTLVLYILGWLTAKTFHFERKLENAFILCVVMVNTGNIGIPVIGFTFDTGVMQRSVLFFALSNLVLNSLGIFLPSRGSFSIMHSMKNTLRVPLIYATVAGLLLNIYNVSLPIPALRVIDLLAQGTIPCMLVILGLQLSKIHIQFRIVPVLLAATIRLIIAPLIGFVLVGILGITGSSLQASIAQISMPTALLAGLYATQFDCEAEYVTTVILFTTIGSILTLSILLPILL